MCYSSLEAKKLRYDASRTKMRVVEHRHKIDHSAMKTCAITHGRPKIAFPPMLVTKTWVEDERHEIAV